jgi:hypothetical protein
VRRRAHSPATPLSARRLEGIAAINTIQCITGAAALAAPHSFCAAQHSIGSAVPHVHCTTVLRLRAPRMDPPPGHSVTPSAVRTSTPGVNLDTLRPEPCVEGYSTPGGYSWKVSAPRWRHSERSCFGVDRTLQQPEVGARPQRTHAEAEGWVAEARGCAAAAQAVKPIALAKCTAIAKILQASCGTRRGSTRPRACAAFVLREVPALRKLPRQRSPRPPTEGGRLLCSPGLLHSPDRFWLGLCVGSLVN